MENEHNVAEDEPISSLIDDSYIEYDSYDGYISTNSIEEIWDGNYVHPDINARDARLKISNRIRKTQREWKGPELSTKSMEKGLHKVFKYVVNKLNN